MASGLAEVEVDAVGVLDPEPTGTASAGRGIESCSGAGSRSEDDILIS